MEFYITNKNRNIAVIITLAAMVVLVAIIINLVLEFNLVENLVMAWILTTFYSICAFWLVGNPIKVVELNKPFYVDNPVTERAEVPIIREVPVQIPMESKIIEVIDRPIEVIREVPVQIPIENNTVEIIDNPVIERVEVPVIEQIEKKVYVKGKKLNIPRFNYVASTETKTFHKRNCRFGKLIKRKYKVHNNQPSWFKRRNFKACKICMKKSH